MIIHFIRICPEDSLIVVVSKGYPLGQIFMLTYLYRIRYCMTQEETVSSTVKLVMTFKQQRTFTRGYANGVLHGAPVRHSFTGMVT